MKAINFIIYLLGFAPLIMALLKLKEIITFNWWWVFSPWLFVVFIGVLVLWLITYSGNAMDRMFDEEEDLV